jgi:predicted secreted acid phosphatase
MSDVKIVIKKGNRKVSFVDHYSYPMNFIQGKAEKKSLVEQLDFLLEHEKGKHFSANLVDAGLIIFDVDSRTIDNRKDGGFGFNSLETFPKGWKMLEDDDVITESNFVAKKVEFEKRFM